MYNEVINFWFEEINPSNWFKKSDEFDNNLKNRFTETHKKASRSELFNWRESALGSLAEIIVLDQFSRNMFRGKPESFMYDNLALALSQFAIQQGFDKNLSKIQLCFLYMPFMHSESPVIHEEAVKLFTNLGNDANLKYELMHKKIIDKFGRYPHRNDILSRTSTSDELLFLQTPGSHF